MKESRIRQVLKAMGYEGLDENVFRYRPTSEEEAVLRERHAKYFGRCEAPFLESAIETNPIYQQSCDICGKLLQPDTDYLLVTFGGSQYVRDWNYIICLDRDACMLRAAVLTERPKLWYEEV